MQYHPQDYCCPQLAQIAPYQPGKSIEELEREFHISNAIKLASNENMLGASARAIEALRVCADKVHFYPNGAALNLKQMLAERHGVVPECITLGNGSNELLELLGRCFLSSGDEVVYSEHAFAVYELTAQICAAHPQVSAPYTADAAMPYGHNLDAMLQCISTRTRVIFIANPNNPTGTWVEENELERFLEQVPHSAIVVLDQAYAEYAGTSSDVSGWMKKYPNLVITRTFSKAFALAGLRIGYALSSVEIAELLNRIRQPFNVNTPALAAAVAALEDTAHIQRSFAMNQAGLEQLHQGCAALGLATLPSQANFVCIEVGGSASSIYMELLRQGIIVRPISNYKLPNHLRVTVGLPEHNQSFLAAMERIITDRQQRK